MRAPEPLLLARTMTETVTAQKLNRFKVVNKPLKVVNKPPLKVVNKPLPEACPNYDTDSDCSRDENGNYIPLTYEISAVIRVAVSRR